MFKFFCAVVIIWIGLATGLFRSVLYGLYELVVGFIEGILPFSIGGLLGILIFIFLIILAVKAVFS